MGSGSCFAIGLLGAGAIALAACGSSAASGDPDASAPPTPALPVDPDDGGTSIPVEPPRGCPSAGRRCTKAPPAGWAGPMLVYDGAVDAVPTCPTTMALRLLDAKTGVPTGPHTCSACACGTSSGVACQAYMQAFSDESCANVTYQMPFGADCAQHGASTKIKTYVVASGGSCTPTGGEATRSAVVWPGALRGCAAPALLSDGCAQGEVCAPEPASPFGAKHCIANLGDVACPAEWPVKRTGASGLDDTRGCTACACGTPANRSCYGAFGTSLNNCLGDLYELPIPLESCLYATSANTMYKVVRMTAVSGACTATGGATTGGLAPKGEAVTVCCGP